MHFKYIVHIPVVSLRKTQTEECSITNACLESIISSVPFLLRKINSGKCTTHTLYDKGEYKWTCDSIDLAYKHIINHYTQYVHLSKCTCKHPLVVC